MPSTYCARDLFAIAKFLFVFAICIETLEVRFVDP